MINFKVFNHNSLKKDSLLAETILDVYDILMKNNGKIENLPITLNLKPFQNTALKNLLSSRTYSLSLLLDGLNVDMSSVPAITTRNSASLSNGTDSSQPSSSTSNHTTSVLAKITSSLPRWSLNDPYNSSSTSNGTIASTSNNSLPSSVTEPEPPQASSSSISQPSTSFVSTPVPEVEERLPIGWEIRFDNYGRYVCFLLFILSEIHCFVENIT